MFDIVPKKIDKVELILLEVFLCHDLSLWRLKQNNVQVMKNKILT